MDESLNSLKRDVFFEFLNLVGRVFILVHYSGDVILGNRGFSDKEKKNGITLVLNSKMKFLWDEYGITVTLVFGASQQKCFIPVDAIVTIYSPELGAQFAVSPQPPGRNQKPEPKIMRQDSKKVTGDSNEAVKSGKVIKVDFTKKK